LHLDQLGIPQPSLLIRDPGISIYVPLNYADCFGWFLLARTVRAQNCSDEYIFKFVPAFQFFFYDFLLLLFFPLGLLLNFFLVAYNRLSKTDKLIDLPLKFLLF